MFKTQEIRLGHLQLPLLPPRLLDNALLAVGIFLRTYGVEKVYSSGLIDEFIGKTKTAIQA